jgi:hypothetical protein
MPAQTQLAAKTKRKHSPGFSRCFTAFGADGDDSHRVIRRVIACFARFAHPGLVDIHGAFSRPTQSISNLNNFGIMLSACLGASAMSTVAHRGRTCATAQHWKYSQNSQNHDKK